MSEDVRAVPLDAEQADLIEEIGLELLRRNEHERATKLLTIFLAWKVSPRANLPTVFRCDIDESAGMAEIHDACGCEKCHPELHNVVELHGWSRRVPCA